MNYTTYDIHYFQSGEIEVSLNAVNNIIYCKLYKDLNQSIMAALIAIAKLRKFHSEITLIMPFLPSSRSDLQPIITILESLGVSKLITVEIHSEAPQSAIEIYNITIIPDVIKEIGIDHNKLVITAPDKGGCKRGKNAAQALKCNFISMEKTRHNRLIRHTLNNPEVVKNRQILIVDDIIDSGGTINSAAEVLINSGAKSVKVLGIHGILSKREFSPLIDKIYITNTIKQDHSINQLEIVDVDNIISSKVEEIINL